MNLTPYVAHGCCAGEFLNILDCGCYFPYNIFMLGNVIKSICRSMLTYFLILLTACLNTDSKSEAIRGREAGEREPASHRFTDAEYAVHVGRLEKKVEGKGFTIVIERPFVVIGDEPETVVRRRAVGTVKWAVDQLKHLYFEEDPEDIIEIWLFRDRPSYETYSREFFGDHPTTPFGYYSHRHHALIMNIATGGGTLVHEIVHPFMEANFPRCPAWFNEGLGSLYEQSSSRGGRITGLTNWRLAGLQRAVRGKAVPSFYRLTHTTSYSFYEEDPGTNYAQARYLCYYLQEKGLLVKFFHEFRARCQADPSGYNTLKRVLGEENMEAFQRNWEAFVLGLSFP